VDGGAHVSRRVLNDTSSPASPTGSEAGEALARAMLRAVGAHTNADGRLDYRAVRRSAEFVAAQAAAARLAGVDPAHVRTRAERLAFWINVYNALALHGIVALDVRGSVWRVWNFFGRVSYRVGGDLLSLDEIEHGILRGNRRRAWPPWPALRAGDPRRALGVDPMDPRIHFALNCGAASCPPVGVYRAATIDADLDLATRNFLNQETTLDASGRVTCSRLLKWYGGDFGSPAALGQFLASHLDDGPVKQAIGAGGVPCQAWRDYSWTLPHPPA
jgi:hypothetical protein